MNGDNLQQFLTTHGEPDLALMLHTLAVRAGSITVDELIAYLK